MVDPRHALELGETGGVDGAAEGRGEWVEEVSGEVDGLERREEGEQVDEEDELEEDGKHGRCATKELVFGVRRFGLLGIEGVLCCVLCFGARARNERTRDVVGWAKPILTTSQRLLRLSGQMIRDHGNR